MRNFHKNILALTAALLVSILLLEIALRLFLPQVTYSTARHSSPQIYQKSEYLPWTLMPGAKDTHIGVYGDFNVSVEINSYGIRDYERPIHSNLTRVLVMGDSMTYGFGVEMNETYAKSLERILNSKGIAYQVFNTGFSDGYSLDSYYLYLKNYALEKFKPDVIIIGFFVYNDVTDVSLNVWESDEQGLLQKITSPYYSVDEEHRLRSAKRTLPLLKNRIVNSLYEGLLTHSHLFVFAKTRVSQWVDVSSSNRIFDLEYNLGIAKDWEKNKKVLSAIHTLSLEHNISLILLALPVRFQIRDAEWTMYKKRIGEGKVSRTRPNDELYDYAKKNNITFVDVYTAFREKDTSAPLFLPIDGHLNAEGHALVAQQLFVQAKEELERAQRT